MPSADAALVAVHARQRTTTEIVRSIAWQLGTAADDTADPGRATLIDAVTATTTPPLVVIDALDEAVRAAEVLREVILPLIHARRPDGRPADGRSSAVGPDRNGRIWTRCSPP